MEFGVILGLKSLESSSGRCDSNLDQQLVMKVGISRIHDDPSGNVIPTGTNNRRWDLRSSLVETLGISFWECDSSWDPTPMMGFGIIFALESLESSSGPHDSNWDSTPAMGFGIILGLESLESSGPHSSDWAPTPAVGFGIILG